MLPLDQEIMTKVRNFDMLIHLVVKDWSSTDYSTSSLSEFLSLTTDYSDFCIVIQKVHNELINGFSIQNRSSEKGD